MSDDDPFEGLKGIPSVADTVNTLALAMRLRKPEASARMLADDYPSERETAAVKAMYAAIDDQLVRQAILDMLVSITWRA